MIGQEQELVCRIPRLAGVLEVARPCGGGGLFVAGENGDTEHHVVDLLGSHDAHAARMGLIGLQAPARLLAPIAAEEQIDGGEVAPLDDGVTVVAACNSGRRCLERRVQRREVVAARVDVPAKERAHRNPFGEFAARILMARERPIGFALQAQGQAVAVSAIHWTLSSVSVFGAWSLRMSWSLRTMSRRCLAFRAATT